MTTNIRKVQFVDAAYRTDSETNKGLDLKPHEACGYVTEHGDSILVTFIQRMRPTSLYARIVALILGPMVVKGLVIPKNALHTQNDTPVELPEMVEGDIVSVTWADVVYIANNRFRQAHTMRTRGVVQEVRNNDIVLRNPTTKRIWPFPRREHAHNATQMVLPLCLIKSIKVAS